LLRLNKPRSQLVSQRLLTLCGCEGNRKSGVALALRHGLTDGLSTSYGLNGHRKEDEHPALVSAYL